MHPNTQGFQREVPPSWTRGSLWLPTFLTLCPPAGPLPSHPQDPLQQARGWVHSSHFTDEAAEAWREQTRLKATLPVSAAFFPWLIPIILGGRRSQSKTASKRERTRERRAGKAKERAEGLPAGREKQGGSGRHARWPEGCPGPFLQLVFVPHVHVTSIRSSSKYLLSARCVPGADQSVTS